MCAKKEPQNQNKREKRDVEADKQDALNEILDLIEKGGEAVTAGNFPEAIQYYEEASLASDLIGDSERANDYLNRVNKILSEHPELKEEARPIVTKKRKRKAKLISVIAAEADEEKLLLEITDLLKRARVALGKENFLEAINCYHEAAVAAEMAGDTERERIYLNRANELLKEHPELKEEGLVIKKRKMKAKLREEEKFSLGRLISNIIIAGIMIILVYSGLFSVILLQEVFELGGSYNISILWGVSIAIGIFGMVLAYLLGTRWLRWPE